MSKNPKVLIVGPNAQGGISSVLKLYEEYGLFNDEVIRLASFKGGNIFYKAYIFVVFLVKYLILLINKNIQIVHIHGASGGSFLRKFVVFKLAKLFNKKVIYHIHGASFNIFYEKMPNFVKVQIREVLAKSDMILVLSQSWREEILKICSSANIRILYNPAVIKEVSKIEHEKINVLFMGRLGKRKGVYDIIEAAKYIQNPEVSINLYGDGDVEEFQKLIIESDVQEKVKIKGWVSGDEKEKVFRSSDIFILPSYNEGLPMSVLEAFSYSLPVISTPVGGTPETVEEGVNGFLIQPGDSKSLADKIDLLANDKELSQKMGQASYKIVKEKFDINVIMNQLREIYDELIK